MRLRVRFWLFVMDFVCLFPGGYGSRVCLYAVWRASNAQFGHEVAAGLWRREIERAKHVSPDPWDG